jgi:hypothetical protein
MILWGIGIFVLDFFIAYSWAACIHAIAERKALKAALFSSFLSLSGAISIISYTENKWFVIPAIAGGAAGIYFSTKYKKP